MADDTLTGQYSVVAEFLAGYTPAWLASDTLNKARVASYSFYDNLYWNDAGGFRLTLRGDEEFPVYVPSARRIINTFNRYVAKGLSLAITGDTPDQVQAAQTAFDVLFKRERFISQFNHGKRSMLVRGDMVMGIFADPLRPEGARISIETIHPASYFPVPDPNNKKKITGQRIVELVHIGDKDYIKVQRWIKSTDPEHPAYNPETPDYEADIAYDDIIWETESWDDPEKRKQYQVVTALDLLPGIKTLPLYHFPNNKEQDNLFGTSDLKGLERIFLAINQTATDEDVAIAMAGLGLYVADASPVDAEGNATDWVLGPKRVVEMPRGGEFKRISGVATVEPSQGHMDWLQSQAESTLGISDVALGSADVSVAESGIALALRMAPLLDAATARDEEVTDVLVQMFHDLKLYWFPVYERLNLGDDVTGALVMPVFADKLPRDRAAELAVLADLFLQQVIPIQLYWEKLRDLGIDIPNDADMIKMFAEAETFMPSADPQGDRLNAEAGGVTPSDGGLG
jgi:hypothetical protein